MLNISNRFLIFLMGPTASGKSQIAMQLRAYLPIELVSVDSALIYKSMNIGTAKPTYSELLKHPHYLINIKDPGELYSVSEFRKDVLKAIEEIFHIGKIPLLVGGTMFYYHILLNGISDLPTANILLRKKLLNYQHHLNNNFLYEYLCKKDPEASHKIHPNDTQRILRALEVYLMTGIKFSVLRKQTSSKLLYNVIQFAIVPNKNMLYKKIHNRFQYMLDCGFEKEVKSLFDRGDLNIDLPSIRCIGYRQMWLYFLNYINYNDMINQSIMATRQLVKKQMTWLKNWNNVYFIHDNNREVIIKRILDKIHTFLKYYNIDIVYK